MSTIEIATAPMIAIRNRKQVETSQTVGCYYCLKIYPATEIKEYTDNTATALCPHCHIDSIIPEKAVENLNQSILKEMHNFWF
jgi:hypothetical protein